LEPGNSLGMVTSGCTSETLYVRGAPLDACLALSQAGKESQGNSLKVSPNSIYLVSHASKIVLKILTRTLESKAEMFLEKDQYGFRKGRGTKDAMKEVWSITKRFMFAMLTLKRLLIVSTGTS